MTANSAQIQTDRTALLDVYKKRKRNFSTMPRTL